MAPTTQQADAAHRLIRCCRPVSRGTKHQRTPGSTSSFTAVSDGASRPSGQRSAPSHPALPPGAPRHQTAHAREHQQLICTALTFSTCSSHRHAPINATSSCAGREASSAPPTLVGRRSNPSQGAAASAAFALRPAPMQPAAAPAVRPAARHPPSSATAATPLRVLRTRGECRLRSSARTHQRKLQPRRP